MDYSKALTKQLQKSNGRKIVLISEGILCTYLRRTFEEMNVKLDKYYDVREMEGEIYLPQDLVHKEREYFIIVAIYTGHKKVVEELVNGGYCYNVDCTVSATNVYTDEIDMVDPLLGYTRTGGICPGIVTYGKLNGKNDLAVLILGNSSSDSTFGNLNCWGHYLFLELSKLCAERNVVIYNGAVSGYYSGQEFLKLCRDGVDLKPSIVISFSGVTEITTKAKGKKLLQKYQLRMWNSILGQPGIIPDSLHMRNMNKLSTGLEEMLSDEAAWIDNERKMYAICKEFGIKFIGCLQPMIAVGCIVDTELKDLLNDMGLDEDFYEAQNSLLMV